MASKLLDLILKKPNSGQPQRNDRRIRTMNIVLAIVLAVILWAYVINEVNPETERTINDVPLRIVGENVLESNGLALLTEFDDTVSVVISGRRSDVYNINAAKLSAKIDVSGCVEGENQVSVQVSAPDKVSKAEARDGDFLVLVDRIVTEDKPVDVEISGDLSADTGVEIISLSENKVSVTGPSTYVKQVAAVSGVLEVQNSVNDYDRAVSLTPVDKEGDPVEGVELSQKTVTVEAQKTLTKTVSVEVVLTGNAPQGMTVTPASNLKLKIRGRYDDIKGISSLKTAPVSISGMTEDTSVDVTVQMPEGVTALDSGGDPIRNQGDGPAVINVDFTVRSASDEGEAASGNASQSGSSEESGGGSAAEGSDTGGDAGDGQDTGEDNSED